MEKEEQKTRTLKIVLIVVSILLVLTLIYLFNFEDKKQDNKKENINFNFSVYQMDSFSNEKCKDIYLGVCFDEKSNFYKCNMLKEVCDVKEFEKVRALKEIFS